MNRRRKTFHPNSHWRGGWAIRAKQPRVDVRSIIDLLSELYPNKAFALVRENLQNSIDAGADRITIDFDPEKREVTFADNGSGVAVDHLNENEYFSLRWSTKRGKDKIGSKGIGRWTNLAAARSVVVESRANGRDAVFTWHSNGSFSQHKSATGQLSHPGLLLHLTKIQTDVAEDLSTKIEDVATNIFDQYLRGGVDLYLNGALVRPREYQGKRHEFRLPSGGRFELYWNRRGQVVGDRGIALKCRGVRVGSLDRFGIESEEWTNIAGILHLDQVPLTANREAFQETQSFRANINEARNKLRAFIAKVEGSRRFRKDRMEDEYTRAAQDVARRLGLDLSILGVAPLRTSGENRMPSEKKEVEEHRERRSPELEGERRGFRLKPVDFSLDQTLESRKEEMSYRQGSVILVNLGHPSCPENKHARSLYIWCCTLVEILRWGVLEGGEQLGRAELLKLYTGWLSMWPRELARWTTGVG